MTTARFANDPVSVRRARAFVADALAEASDEQRDRAVLITSELATNAIVHAGSGFTVTATATTDDIRIAITDAGGDVPTMRHPGQTEVHGRGLLITDSLADDWGVDVGADGTTVWFTLALVPRFVGSQARFGHTDA